MSCYNLALLEKLFTRFGEVKNIEEWHRLLNFLYINQLIEPQDLLRIKDSVIYFPVQLENLKKIVMNSNRVDALSEMGEGFDRLYNQMNDCRTTLKRWNLGTFSIDDMTFTTKTYEEILQEFEDLKREFDEFAHDVMIVNQPIQSLKRSVASYPSEVPDPDGYLVKNRDRLDKEFSRCRVKSVQYRNQSIRILKQLGNGIKVQIGFDQMNDAPVEVWIIPKRMWEQQEQCELLNTFEAHFELILSTFFPKYLGQNLISDAHYYQHYMELTRGHSFRYLIKNKKRKAIDPMGPFFRVTMAQVFHALFDILSMTRFQPSLPITLSNLQVSNDGTKIYLKNVKFPELRENSTSLEATLLENFAQIVMSALGLHRKDIGRLGGFLVWKNLLEGLFNAEEDHLLNERGVVQGRIGFSQLVHHDLFDEDLLSHFEIQDIVKDYHETFEV